MHRIFTFAFLFITSLTAQGYVLVSVGASYIQQAYYTFSDDNINTLDITTTIFIR